MTNAELKQHNLNQVYRLIYNQQTIAKSDIATIFNLSRPTISQFINELEDKKLIQKNGVAKSTGGRKPIIYSCIGDARIAIGVELITNQFEISAVDLYGKILYKETHHIPFVNEERFFIQFGKLISLFIMNNQIQEEKILGIGIALQGLVSYDGTKVTYGTILQNNDVTIEDFQRYLNYPLVLIHDSEAAATDALWNSKTLHDVLFICLSQHIGGALIVNRQIHWGSVYPSGLFEHMTIVPDGAPCYCGKKGCFESYCSIQSLISDLDPSLDIFFKHLSEKNPLYLIRWQQFLNHLAIAIDNLQMVINCDVVLGGPLASYFTKEDLDLLTLLVEKDSAFNKGRPSIHILPDSCISRGAALHYIENFINTI